MRGPLTLRLALRHLGSPHRQGSLSLTTVLTIFGVALGVAILVLTLGILNGFELVVSKKIIQMDGHVRVKPLYDNNADRATETDRRLRKWSGWVSLQPYLEVPALIRRGRDAEPLQLLSLQWDNHLEGYFLPPRGGAGIDSGETAAPRGLFIGEALADRMRLSVGDSVVVMALGGLPHPGKNPRLERLPIGALFRSGIPDYDESVAYLDRSLLGNLTEADGTPSGWVGRVKDPLRLEEAVAELSPLAGPHYFVDSWRGRHQVLLDWFAFQRYPIAFIFALVVAVAILNIASSLTMMVMRKTREIGVLAAMGLGRRTIGSLFLLEGGIIGIAGCLAGTVLAFGLIGAQHRFGWVRIPEAVYFTPVLSIEPDWLHVLAVAGGALAVTMAASLYPAYRATSVVPAEAVRCE